MEQEIWKDIIGYEGLYMVSNLGRVKALDRLVLIGNDKNPLKAQPLKEHIKKPTLSHGYSRLCLCKNGKVHRFQVHRLVAIAFIENKENKPQVNHINGIKTDNRVVNLEWATQSENQKHAYRIGLQSMKGENHPEHKATEKVVREIREKYLPNIYTIKMLAKEYGLGVFCVNSIIYKHTWKHLL